MELTKKVKVKYNKKYTYCILTAIPLHEHNNEYNNNYLKAFKDWFVSAKEIKDSKYFEFIKAINSDIINCFFDFLELNNIKDIQTENRFKLIKEFNENRKYFYKWVKEL